MSITILRTADAWWVRTPGGAARIDTDATTTGELLAEPEQIHAARASRTTVDPATLDLVSPVTAPCRVVAQMTNFASHVKDAGLNPDTIPLTFFRKTSGSISGPFDDIVRPGHVRCLDYEVEIGLVIGRELPVGTQVTADNWASFVAGLVVTNDVSARDVQLPKTQFFESKSYPTFTPVGPSLVLLDDDELKRFGDLRLRLWVNGELRQDAVVDDDMIYSPLEALQALSRFQRLDAGRPAADRDPGGHRPERTAEAGRDHRRTPAARTEVEAVLPAPGPEPQVPQARRRRRGHHRHRRRCDRPRPAAHRGEGRPDAATSSGRRTTGRATSRRSRPCRWPTVACRARPTSCSSGPPGCGRTGSPCPCCRTANGGSSRRSEPSPSCWPTCIATPTCSTPSGCAATDGVALLAPNCDELITATLAAELAGIAAPINSGLSREHIAELLRRSGARVLVAAGPDLAPEVWESARELAVEAGIEALLALSPTGAGAAGPELHPIDGVRIGHLSALAAEQPHDAFVGQAPSATDLAAVFHTGGTTGTPKLAAHTHANEVSDAWMIAAIGLLDRRGRWPSPRCRSSTSTPWSSPCWRRCSRGSGSSGPDPLGYRDTTLFANFWKVVERYRISHMSGVPTMYAVLAGPPRRRRHQQPAVRPRRRVPAAAGGPERLRVRHRRTSRRGLRPDRGDLRQRPELPRPPAARMPSASACPTSR